MPSRRMTVVMPFHTPFYAPLSAGAALGHFADEGLDVEVLAASAFGKAAVPALLDGDIQISLGGIMRSLDLADRTGQIVVHFAEVCSRNGFFLLSREPRPGFVFSDLVGRTVLSFAEAPTPWQCMLTVLRRNGVDPGAVHIDRSRPAPEAVAAFRAGTGDFLEQTQPIAEQLIEEGVAHLAASMGEATGPVPFTSYMTTPEFLLRERALVVGFTRAVYRTQRWLAAAAPREIAAAVAKDFPEIEPGRLERIARRFAAQGTWARDPLLRRPGYDYLQEILLAGGFIRARHRYEDLIDTGCAEEAMAATGPR
jgi:NitT/TauT family transport system substrate-binding protein